MPCNTKKGGKPRPKPKPKELDEIDDGLAAAGYLPYQLAKASGDEIRSENVPF